MIHALLTSELQWQAMTPLRFLLALEFLGTRSVFVLFCFVLFCFLNRLRSLNRSFCSLGYDIMKVEKIL